MRRATGHDNSRVSAIHPHEQHSESLGSNDVPSVQPEENQEQAHEPNDTHLLAIGIPIYELVRLIARSPTRSDRSLD